MMIPSLCLVIGAMPYSRAQNSLLIVRAVLLLASSCAATAPVGHDSHTPKPPVWPLAWNATLAKTAPNVSEIYWTKFYYDWCVAPVKICPPSSQLHRNTPATRFDFFNNFPDISGQWTLNCSILFINTTVRSHDRRR